VTAKAFRECREQEAESERCGELRNKCNVVQQKALVGGFPMNRVDHDEAAQYCKLRGGRLPTVAEWELALQRRAPVGLGDKSFREWADDSLPSPVVYRAGHGWLTRSAERARPPYRAGWKAKTEGDQGLGFRCVTSPTGFEPPSPSGL